MQLNKHAVVLLNGQERWGMSHFFFRGETRSHYFFMFPLSLNTIYDGVTVFKQSTNRAIRLATIWSYASRAGFPHFLEVSRYSFLRVIHTPASKIVLMNCGWTNIYTSRRYGIVKFKIKITIRIYKLRT